MVTPNGTTEFGDRHFCVPRIQCQSPPLTQWQDVHVSEVYYAADGKFMSAQAV